MQLGAINPVGTANAPMQIGAADVNFTSLEARVKKMEDTQKYAKIILIALVVLYILNKMKK
jgi:hypothetical protein